MTRRAILYLDAARHVRARQIAGRARRLIPPHVLAAGLDRPTWIDYLPAARGLGAPVAPQSGPHPDPATSGEFIAYGHSRCFDGQDFWRGGSEGLLYRFHLHGFVALAEYAAGPAQPAADRFWSRVVEAWLDAHSRPSLPAWHPYPTSSRVVAWCSALGALEGWSPGFRQRVASEVHRQARYLRRAVEHDIGGNHVLSNAKALVFAGATIPSTGLLKVGLHLLRRELERQLLADGGHEERSTSYQREVAGDLAALTELIVRTGAEPPEWLRQSLRRTQQWLAALTGPDNRLPMLNDAWEGPAMLERTHAPATMLAPSGYVALRADDDQAVIDCGPVCPDHLPPHAHADVLAFVLWVDGEPVIVDPGAYAYTGPERAWFRATAAHNTVELDGQDQCVFWGDFRAGLLPRVKGPWLRTADGVVVVEGSHDGYRRLPDPTIHHRAFVWVPGAGIVLVDRLHCRQPHQVRSSLLLAPGIKRRDGLLGGLVIRTLGAGLSTQSEQASYAPYLGCQVASSKLVARGQAGPRTAFGWSLLRSGASALLSGEGGVEIRREAAADPIRIQLSSLE